MSHIRACGTTFYQGRKSLAPLRLAPVTHGSAQAPATPSTSVLPPMGPRPLGESGDRPILTSSDCEHGHTIVVTNVDKARTLAVAHTEDGGIAGLDLVITTTPVTIYAYTGHRLTS
jgi:hypothetical protein